VTTGPRPPISPMLTPRILILGSSGQLGRELQSSFASAGTVLACGRDVADLSNPEALRALVRTHAPEIILNAAAYTAVDRAESEPDVAMAVNARAPEVLAEEAKRLGALLVHYSTDYVFDGAKSGAWTENDMPHPLGVYGVSKLEGERAIARIGGRFLIFRTSWVYGPHGKNFLLTMLRLGRERDRVNVVDDQIGAPTTSFELASATRAIINGIVDGGFGAPDSWAGIYHMSCGGAVSWCGFARAIFGQSRPMLGGRIPEVHPIPTSEYPTPARRPQNSVLSNEKLNARFGVKLAGWEKALDAVFGELNRQN
jgi:dTDP-4-dehydrorhamnose reductase